MAITIKNLHQTENKTYAGMQLTPGATYNVPTDELKTFQGADNLINDITLATPEASVNDLTGSAGINELMRIDQKDSEGALMSRTKVTKSGWSYHVQGVEFTTSKVDSVYNKDMDGNDLGFTTYTMKDVNGAVTTNEMECTQTIVDWEPTHDYEIIGGQLKMDMIPTDNIRAYVIGVPDVPAQYGGSKEFICCVNMKYIKAKDAINADGRASKELKFDPVNHTNKMRLVLNHSAGTQANFLMLFEIFKP